jgi:hypothetical protein
MRWDSTTHADFSTADLWLALGGTFDIAIEDVARGSVENLGKPMPFATSPIASSSG